MVCNSSLRPRIGSIHPLPDDVISSLRCAEHAIQELVGHRGLPSLLHPVLRAALSWRPRDDSEVLPEDEEEEEEEDRPREMTLPFPPPEAEEGEAAHTPESTLQLTWLYEALRCLVNISSLGAPQHTPTRWGHEEEDSLLVIVVV